MPSCYFCAIFTTSTFSKRRTGTGKLEHDYSSDGLADLEDEHLDENSLLTELNLKIGESTGLKANSVRAAESYQVSGEWKFELLLLTLNLTLHHKYKNSMEILSHYIHFPLSQGIYFL